MKTNIPLPSNESWQSIVAKYNKPDLKKSIWQLINSLGVYFLLWIIMIQTIQISFWLTLPLIILASGFMVRVFIIFHDCGHGSFFKSRKANEIVGMVCGMMAFTPYHKWTDSHQLHHQTVGNLDRRGLGDVWTLTAEEYQAKGRFGRFIYSGFRHPIFLLGIGGPAMFVFFARFTNRRMTKKQRMNVYFTNVILAVWAVGMSYLIGWQSFLLIQGPIIYLGTTMGVYLFYLQHQYEDVKWCRAEEWNYKEMALEGSSFFKLPRILNWFSGSIGFHHVHHLGPTIPNYNLVRCHNENQMFSEIKPISLFHSFHSLNLRVWDESKQKIVSFREMRS